ncbi:hypothetical protein Taro_031260 [Colocasia esculenta]|uniref:Uncharacterized protein n=1 Tax=Colocasia esculenta TaxID=4460 RepID=A0A843W5W1_COLES|nr:hypothetical protein [Colocasia esculenta]
MRTAAADQAGNDGLEGGVRGKLLGVLRPETLEVSGMDLQLCVCRFDSFKVCPGVDTVVTAVVVCGVPEWWHNFGYGWYLYPVWVVSCDLPLNVLYPSSGPAVCLACNGVVADLYHQQ